MLPVCKSIYLAESFDAARIQRVIGVSIQGKEVVGVVVSIAMIIAPAVLANASITLALSAHSSTVQLSVYNVSAGWRSELGQYMPNRCLASAGIPVNQVINCTKEKNPPDLEPACLSWEISCWLGLNMPHMLVPRATMHAPVSVATSMMASALQFFSA